MNLRAQVETDLAFTLEGDWGMKVVLISPDGIEQTKSKNDPENDLMGRIVYDHTDIDTESGLEVLVKKPVVTLRLTSLDRVPLCGETWEMLFPVSPEVGAPIVRYILIGRPPESGNSIGTIRLYPQLPEQY